MILAGLTKVARVTTVMHSTKKSQFRPGIADSGKFRSAILKDRKERSKRRLEHSEPRSTSGNELRQDCCSQAMVIQLLVTKAEVKKSRSRALRASRVSKATGNTIEKRVISGSHDLLQ